MRSDALLPVFDSFHDAAFGSGGWLAALDRLARATGSRAGELIGLGSAHTVPFNWVSGMSDEWVDAFRAIDGGDPSVNPHVRAGLKPAELEIISSEEFVTRDEWRTNRFLNEHCVEFDIPYTCLAPLVRSPDLLIGLAVLRSRSQGEIDDDQRRVFAAAAPHVRAAVRAQLALEHQGGLLMAAALEALSVAAFVCDRHARVRAMTPEAERLVADHGRLRLRDGNLIAGKAAETAAIARAIDVVSNAAPDVPPLASVLVGAATGRPLVIEVLRVPGKGHMFSFDPRVLVVARERRGQPERLSTLLCAMYGLTPAEAESVRHLLEGLTAAEVAAAREVATVTARTQIRQAYEKMGVRGYAGLLALVNRLT